MLLLDWVDRYSHYKQLADAGVKRVSVGSALSRAALGAFVGAAREMKDLGTFDFAREALPYAEANTLMKVNFQ